MRLSVAGGRAGWEGWTPVTDRAGGGTTALRFLERRAPGLDPTLPRRRIHASRDPSLLTAWSRRSRLWAPLAKAKLRELDTRIAQADRAKTLVQHALAGPHRNLVLCPNFRPTLEGPSARPSRSAKERIERRCQSLSVTHGRLVSGRCRERCTSGRDGMVLVCGAHGSEPREYRDRDRSGPDDEATNGLRQSCGREGRPLHAQRCGG